MDAKVRLPATEGSRGVWINGHAVMALREGAWWVLEKDVKGSVSMEVH
jgi:hypothetical protein